MFGWDVPAKPKPIHCVVRSNKIEGMGPSVTWKYKSMIARMSVAYADVAPEPEMTLRRSVGINWCPMERCKRT